MWNLKAINKGQVFQIERNAQNQKSKGQFKSTAVQFGWIMDPEGDGQKCVRDKLEGESGLL